MRYLLGWVTECPRSVWHLVAFFLPRTVNLPEFAQANVAMERKRMRWEERNLIVEAMFVLLNKDTVNFSLLF